MTGYRFTLLVPTTLHQSTIPSTHKHTHSSISVALIASFMLNPYLCLWQTHVWLLRDAAITVWLLLLACNFTVSCLIVRNHWPTACGWASASCLLMLCWVLFSPAHSPETWRHLVVNWWRLMMDSLGLRSGGRMAVSLTRLRCGNT